LTASEQQVNDNHLEGLQEDFLSWAHHYMQIP
jgi:hypothetical protein